MQVDAERPRLGLGRVAMALVVLAALVCGPAASATASGRRAVGDIQVWAQVPYPGNPGQAFVDGNTVWVDSSAANLDRPFDGQSVVWAYDARTHQLSSRRPNPIVVPEKSVNPMGLGMGAQDAEGRLYWADMNGRVVRIDPRTNKVETYATVPTATWTTFTTMPNGLAFGPDGSLYISDTGGEPIIWRVPPGGGQAQAWYVDPQAAATWGATMGGLAVDPTGKQLYYESGNQRRGIGVYRVPLANPDLANREVVHTYTDYVDNGCQLDTSNPNPNNAAAGFVNCRTVQEFGATGIVIGQSGRIYVTFLGKDQVSILNPDGTEALRFPSTEQNKRSPVPIDGALGLSFDGKGSLLIGNVGEPTLGYGPGHTPPPGGVADSKSWAILSAWVGDTAAKTFQPRIPPMPRAARTQVAANMAQLVKMPNLAICILPR
jgi:sugar lactone lactonase YvrE